MHRTTVWVRDEADLSRIRASGERAYASQISDGRGSIVIASAGALVNDGRRDASYVEVLAGHGRLAAWRRSVATGLPSLLYEGARSSRR